MIVDTNGKSRKLFYYYQTQERLSSTERGREEEVELDSGNRKRGAT